MSKGDPERAFSTLEEESEDRVEFELKEINLVLKSLEDKELDDDYLVRWPTNFSVGEFLKAVKKKYPIPQHAKITVGEGNTRTIMDAGDFDLADYNGINYLGINCSERPFSFSHNHDPPPLKSEPYTNEITVYLGEPYLFDPIRHLWRELPPELSTESDRESVLNDFENYISQIENIGTEEEYRERLVVNID